MINFYNTLTIRSGYFFFSNKQIYSVHCITDIICDDIETLNPRIVLLVYFTVLVHGRCDYKK